MIEEANLAAAAADLPKSLLKIARDLRSRGAQAYLVGGWVRDALLGLQSKDYDIEVFSMDYENLRKVLSVYARPNLVGRAFGAIKIRVGKNHFDFVCPRTDSKVGPGHRGFNIRVDTNLTYAEAALRRDFTINSMGLSLPELDLMDPHGGVNDLRALCLRHVSPAFSDDPLRALRAVQFAARFDLSLAAETAEICSQQPLGELAAERVFSEFKKFLLKAKLPSVALNLLKNLKLLRFFPILESLSGDDWQDTLEAVDGAAKLAENLNEDRALVLMLAALCQSLGEETALEFLQTLTREKNLLIEVLALVRDIDQPELLYQDRHRLVGMGAAKRLAIRVDLDILLGLARYSKKLSPSADLWFQNLIENFNLRAIPRPWLTGKLLLSLGMKPGPRIGALLREGFNLQLDGHFGSFNEAKAWAKEKLEEDVSDDG